MRAVFSIISRWREFRQTRRREAVRAHGVHATVAQTGSGASAVSRGRALARRNSHAQRTLQARRSILGRLSAPESLEDRRVLAVTVQIDYSFDVNNFFDTQEKRSVLEAAAVAVTSRLDDSLLAISPSGDNTWTARFDHPGTGVPHAIQNLPVAADTLILFVGGRDLSDELAFGGYGGFQSQGTAAWNDVVQARGELGALEPVPTDFGPWGGSLTFDAVGTKWHFGLDTSGLTADAFDFYSVAMHEIVHVLGFGVAPSWMSLVSGSLFTGQKSSDRFGSSVPLHQDLEHWQAGTQDGTVETAMDPDLSAGVRKPLTELDVAGLNDLGWGTRETDNQAPINLVPGRQVIYQSAPLAFSTANGNLISVSDFDAGQETMQVSLTATGTMALTALPGITFIQGDGEADSLIVISGALEDLNAALATLVFTPIPNFSGQGSLLIETNDQGNTGLGGPLSDSDTIIIDINPANQPPEVTGLPNLHLQEDDAPTVVHLFDGFEDLEDSDDRLAYSVTDISNPAVIASISVDGLTGHLTIGFTSNAFGTTNVTVRARDRGGMTADAVFQIELLPTNDAPVLDPAFDPALPAVLGNVQDPAGATVASLLAGAVFDPDLSTVAGMAIVGTTGNSQGQWQYSLDQGQSWLALGAASSAAARLLRDVDLLRYVPDSNVRLTATVQFVAWDTTAGDAGDVTNISQSGQTGGTTAFSLASDTALVEVLSVGAAPGVYDPLTGTFFIRHDNSTGDADLTFTFGAGNNGFSPLAGDWNADGKDGIGLYHRASGVVFVKNTLGTGFADEAFVFGPGGQDWEPLVGDWNGDGQSSLGLYNRATGTFFLKDILATGNADVAFAFGPAGSTLVPLVGDWDGDGRVTVGLYDATTGLFFITNTHTTGFADATFLFGPGGSEYTPLGGDWNGDAQAGTAIYKAGSFFLRNSNSTGFADVAFQFGPTGQNWVPLCGDWDGPPGETLLASKSGTGSGLVDPPGTLSGAVLPGTGTATIGAGVGLHGSALIGLALQEATARWAHMLPGTSAVERLSGVTVQFADLATRQLGLTVGKTIYLDADAAGHGWFADTTPWDDVEFAEEFEAALPGSLAPGGALARMDLLSVLMHELGHVLGLEHSHEEAADQAGAHSAEEEAWHAIMQPVLTPGTRTSRRR